MCRSPFSPLRPVVRVNSLVSSNPHCGRDQARFHGSRGTSTVNWPMPGTPGTRRFISSGWEPESSRPCRQQLSYLFLLYCTPSVPSHPGRVFPQLSFRHELPIVSIPFGPCIPPFGRKMPEGMIFHGGPVLSRSIGSETGRLFAGGKGF